MGVYIEMEMPKDCLKCPFCLFAGGYWKCLVDGSHADFGGTCRPSLCPLISVPEHGRLIDVDAVLDGLAHKLGIRSLDYLTPSERAIVSWFKDASTVIPASEEG